MNEWKKERKKKWISIKLNFYFRKKAFEQKMFLIAYNKSSFIFRLQLFIYWRKKNILDNSCSILNYVFQVSVVEDDSFLNKLRSSPTSPTYLTERLGTSTSPKSSEKTWKSPLNSFLNNQNLETLGLKEISVNDMMMSTSFIENGSQDGSVDGKDGNQSKSDDSDDEGLESTSEEFEWKVSCHTFKSEFSLNQRIVHEFSGWNLKFFLKTKLPMTKWYENVLNLGNRLRYLFYFLLW